MLRLNADTTATILSKVYLVRLSGYDVKKHEGKYCFRFNLSEQLPTESFQLTGSKPHGAGAQLRQCW